MYRPIFVSLVLSALAGPVGFGAEDFELAEGLAASPAVEPGLVKHPMMGALDDQGRLYLAESTGVNLKKEELLEDPPHFIRRIEDTDGDGVFDKSVIFADGLTFPQGALWIHDSLYVMSPPSLWRFQDADGDGKAEIREELVGGFDFTGNAADVHGPFLHPNGRLFWCHGRKGFAVTDNDTGEMIFEGKGARIWSSQLSGGEVEPFAGGGMDNPVEIDFTDEGEILGTVNLFYGRPRGDTLTQWVHGGAYPRYDQGLVLEEFRKTGDLLPPVHDFGHVAVSGMCRYRSGKINRDWADQWLVSHFNTSRITRTRTTRKGTLFAAEETETLFELLSPDAHLTDVLEDHNGDLLAIDTGGWFRIGCPTSQIAKPEIAGGIYRISASDAPPYVKPTYPKWDRLTSEEVAAFLDADEHWLQERAITELAVRGDPAIPELSRVIEGGESSTDARRNAVWTLARMKFSESADLIFAALTDHDPGVRQAACNAVGVTRSWQLVAANQPAEREIELERNRTISGALAGILRGDEPAVARAAAVALGKMGESRAIGAVLGRLGRVEDDRFFEHSLIHALIDIDDFDATRNALASENPKVVGGVLRALDQMPSSSIEALDILPFFEMDDEKLRGTVVDIAKNHPEWDAALANRFFEWNQNLDEPRRAILSELIPPFADAPPVTDYLTSLITSDNRSHRRLGLTLLSRSPDAPFQPEWKPVLDANLSPKASPQAPGEFRELTLDAIAARGGKHFEPALKRIAADASLANITRVKAARALTSQNDALSSEAFDLIIEILREESGFETRSRAIGILADSKLTPAQRIALAEVADSFGPVEMQSFFDLFPKIDEEEQARTLADAVLNSSAFANLDFNRLRRVFARFDEAILDRIEEKIAEVEAVHATKQERIAALIDLMPEADAERGKAVFASGKGACLVCHQIGEAGGKVGPSLSTVGRIRTSRDLFESVLYPSESIARDFETFEIHLKEESAGTRLGLIEARTADNIELIDPAGQSHLIDRSTIASIRPVPASLMPMGLEQTMTESELLDLVAYMLEQK
ncbi:MAG: HEAT repeat domain-containing protein [Verrucomicrobiales bacterium]